MPCFKRSALLVSFVMTATLYFIGTLVAVTEEELVLEDAAWVADTGRFNEFMGGKAPNELEPCHNPIVISRGAIVCAMPRKNLIIELR